MRDTTMLRRNMFALLTVAAWLFLMPPPAPAQYGNQGSSPASQQKTRKTPAMREQVYNKFAAAQEAIEAGD